MSAFALISDLHSNLEALEAVFRRIDQLGISETHCLGDVVGYGADPEACGEIVMERCGWTIMGNHDWGLFHELVDFNPLAREALLFTRKRLKPGLITRRRRALWSFLESLPERREDRGYIFCHGSPRNPIMEYVLKSDGFLEPEKMKEIFSTIDRPCFVGHTHWPGVHGGPGGRVLRPSDRPGRRLRSSPCRFTASIPWPLAYRDLGRGDSGEAPQGAFRAGFGDPVGA